MEDASLITNLVIAAIAGWQAVETWHHGSIFGGPKAWLWVYRENKDRSWVGRKIAELLTCPFCLSHWTCTAAVLVMLLTEGNSAWKLPVYCLAAIRVAQLLNDLSHSLTRSPSGDIEIDLTKQVEMRVLDE